MLLDSKKFVDVIICCCGLIFIVSAVSKTLYFDSFPHTVNMFCALLGLNMLYGYGVPLSVGIILFELIIGVCAFVCYFRKIVVWMYPGVFTFFAYITYINYTSPYGGIGSCGCFGELLELSPSISFYKNIILLVLSLLSAILYQLQESKRSIFNNINNKNF